MAAGLFITKHTNKMSRYWNIAGLPLV